MDYNASGISQVAMFNKKDLKNKFFNIPISDTHYKFKISGVGNRFIKIEKYFYYSDIIKEVNKGNKDGLEFALEQLIVDPNKNKKPVLEDPFELRERAIANKTNLKQSYINFIIGNKKYAFKIAGVGFKSIKLELYVGYEDIVKELSLGNNYSLEYLVMELIMGNDIDYSKFEDFASDDSVVIVEENNDGANFDEVNLNSIEKLSEKEFDEIILNVSGWNKLVFDAIDDIYEDLFTFDVLLNQKRILSYQSRDDDLEDKVLENLNQLIDFGLVLKVDDTSYFKLW